MAAITSSSRQSTCQRNRRGDHSPRLERQDIRPSEYTERAPIKVSGEELETGDHALDALLLPTTAVARPPKAPGSSCRDGSRHTQLGMSCHAHRLASLPCQLGSVLGTQFCLVQKGPAAPCGAWERGPRVSAAVGRQEGQSSGEPTRQVELVRLGYTAVRATTLGCRGAQVRVIVTTEFNKATCQHGNTAQGQHNNPKISHQQNFHGLTGQWTSP